MATLNRPLTLRHRPNLGEEEESCEFAAGAAFTVLQEWETHVLCRSDAGHVYNIPKDALALD